MNVMRFWGMKLLSMIYMIGLPCYFHGLKHGLVLFLVGHLICGETLATMFIVNHVIEGVAFAHNDSRTGNNAKPLTTHGISPMTETLKGMNKDVTKVSLNDWAAVQVSSIRHAFLFLF